MIIAPKAEQYTQRAAIEFYKQCAKHGYSVESIGFKSYATLFYSELDYSFKSDTSFANFLSVTKRDYDAKNINIKTSYGLIRTNWITAVKTPRRACIVTKITNEEVIKRDCPYLKELYRQNGFIFYMRVFDDRYKSWGFLEK